MSRAERGSVSLVVVAGTLALSLFALAAADLGVLLVARARAQAAADAAALAAVVEQIPVLSSGLAPEEAARAIAERNGARLASCDCAAGSASATVVVDVPARAGFVPAWRGRRAHATARATADPDLLSYRSGDDAG